MRLPFWRLIPAARPDNTKKTGTGKRSAALRTHAVVSELSAMALRQRMPSACWRTTPVAATHLIAFDPGDSLAHLG